MVTIKIDCFPPIISPTVGSSVGAMMVDDATN